MEPCWVLTLTTVSLFIGAMGSRLLSTGSLCSGIVEVVSQSSWGVLSANIWDNNMANVLCKETNCGTVQAILNVTSAGEESGNIWLGSTCSGTENSLESCGAISNFSAGTQVAGVVCSKTVFPLKKVATRVVISSNAPMQDADNRIVKKAMEEQLMSMLYEGTHMYFPGIKVITRKDETTGKES